MKPPMNQHTHTFRVYIVEFDEIRRVETAFPFFVFELNFIILFEAS